MEQRKYKTKQEVLIRGQEAVGKTLGEIDKTGRIATGKGAIGTVVEESWFISPIATRLPILRKRASN